MFVKALPAVLLLKSLHAGNRLGAHGPSLLWCSQTTGLKASLQTFMVVFCADVSPPGFHSGWNFVWYMKR